MAASIRARLAGFIAGGLVVTLLLAAVVSGLASGEPDGLERVAEDEGFADTATDHAWADGPLADYAVRGVDDERLSTGLSGVIGVAITFVLGAGLFFLFRRRGGGDGGQPPRLESEASGASPAGGGSPSGGTDRP